MEMRSFTGNYHKFNSATGWKPGVDLETGIRRTVEEVKKTFL
jgi:nucleoside-diphosphate-sugar epimerase